MKVENMFAKAFEEAEHFRFEFFEFSEFFISEFSEFIGFFRLEFCSFLLLPVVTAPAHACHTLVTRSSPAYGRHTDGVQTISEVIVNASLSNVSANRQRRLEKTKIFNALSNDKHKILYLRSNNGIDNINGDFLGFGMASSRLKSLHLFVGMLLVQLIMFFIVFSETFDMWIGDKLLKSGFSITLTQLFVFGVLLALIGIADTYTTPNRKHH